MTDVVTDSGDHESKDIHRPQDLAHATSCFDLLRPAPPSLVIAQQRPNGRCDAESDEEGITRLQDVDGVHKVVICVAIVISGSKGDEEGAYAFDRYAGFDAVHGKDAFEHDGGAFPEFVIAELVSVERPLLQDFDEVEAIRGTDRGEGGKTLNATERLRVLRGRR